jgi:transposase
MQPMYYIGLDVHKRKISYCVKDSSGKLHSEGSIPATRFDLDRWMKTLPQPWSATMEATMFTGWIYDHLKPRRIYDQALWIGFVIKSTKSFLKRS